MGWLRQGLEQTLSVAVPPILMWARVPHATGCPAHRLWWSLGPGLMASQRSRRA